jgi:hypothetical protein
MTHSFNTILPPEIYSLNMTETPRHKNPNYGSGQDARLRHPTDGPEPSPAIMLSPLSSDTRLRASDDE